MDYKIWNSEIKHIINIVMPKKNDKRSINYLYITIITGFVIWLKVFLETYIMAAFTSDTTW